MLKNIFYYELNYDKIKKKYTTLETLSKFSTNYCSTMRNLTVIRKKLELKIYSLWYNRKYLKAFETFLIVTFIVILKTTILKTNANANYIIYLFVSKSCYNCFRALDKILLKIS